MTHLLAVAASLAVAYLLLLAALLAARPKGHLLADALRLLPDVVRLLRRLATDPTVPRAARLRLWLLLGYLAVPVDLVPDFVPVLGYADDAIIASLVLRSVVRRAGPAAIQRHWPGTTNGLIALSRLARLPLDEPRPARPGTPVGGDERSRRARAGSARPGRARARS
jgi:uncharacterized membrane protein YkvA (DUF1232 family)